MATHLKGTSTTPITPQITRWKIAAISTVSLALLFLGLSSQFLLFERPGSHHTHSSQKLHSTQEVLDVGSRHDRPLVAYAYAESNNARENLKFFLKRGLHAGADFIFIFNGETNASELVPAHLANVKIVKRDNTCYDMGAFGEVLSKDRLWMKYKRFITLNASIRGPFLPIWSNECWTDAFLSKVTDKIKVSGLNMEYTHHLAWFSTQLTLASLSASPITAFQIPTCSRCSWPRIVSACKFFWILHSRTLCLSTLLHGAAWMILLDTRCVTRAMSKR